MEPWQESYSLSTQAVLWAPIVLLLVALALLATHLVQPNSRRWTWKALAGLGGAMMLAQLYLSLVWVPPEKYMGDTGRIFYAHVPQVWMMLLGLTLNFGCCLAYLFKKSWVSDSLAEASAEVGVYFGAVGVSLGAIWAKPTWGVWWTWDPRLISVTILLLVYAGYLALRRFIEDPEARATFSSVVGIFAFVSIPLVWFSVKWWRSMHQTQSNPQTVDPLMTAVLRWSATAFLCLLIVFTYQRFLAAHARVQREVALPDALPTKGAALS
jgi:heme exporter protein C